MPDYLSAVIEAEDTKITLPIINAKQDFCTRIHIAWVEVEGDILLLCDDVLSIENRMRSFNFKILNIKLLFLETLR